MVVQHHPKCRDQRRVVLQRLSHAHQDHVGDDTLRAAKVPAQEVLGKPELRHDFTGTQIAAETLVPGRAEAATDSATGLRRNTQCAAVVFRNEHGFDRIAATNVEQPLDSAIARPVFGRDHQAFDTGRSLELLAQWFGKITHRVETGGALLMDPAEQLRGTKAFFPQSVAKRGQTLEVVVEKIGQHDFAQRG